MSLGGAVIIVLCILFIINEIRYFALAPNRLAKAEPYKMRCYDGYGPDRNGFNCAIKPILRHGKRYYRISWKAADGFWQPDYKPLPGHDKVILFKKEKDAAAFIAATNGLLLEKEDFYKAVRKKQDEIYEIR